MTRPDNEVVQGKKREVTSFFRARAGYLDRPCAGPK
jgi:hypothetical protein